MYICICKAITTKMLEENAFLYHQIGTGCGKCLEGDITAGRVTFLGGDKDSTGVVSIVENRPGSDVKRLT